MKLGNTGRRGPNGRPGTNKETIQQDKKLFQNDFIFSIRNLRCSRRAGEIYSTLRGFMEVLGSELRAEIRPVSHQILTNVWDIELL